MIPHSPSSPRTRSGGVRCREDVAQASSEGPAKARLGCPAGAWYMVQPAKSAAATTRRPREQQWAAERRKKGCCPYRLLDQRLHLPLRRCPAPGRRPGPVPGAAHPPAPSPQSARPHRALPAAAASAARCAEGKRGPTAGGRGHALPPPASRPMAPDSPWKREGRATLGTTILSPPAPSRREMPSRTTAAAAPRLQRARRAARGRRRHAPSAAHPGRGRRKGPRGARAAGAHPAPPSRARRERARSPSSPLGGAARDFPRGASR